ncbi:hypothetical protein [Halorubrum salsamenti]|jgi:hypothetical protein|uniref:hypothetical protein n=1 Tax=Halorubrum salsamenti TaxID=2583990 RepID=UPI0011A03BDB|nr:hypothetical protein [Halorubrum salsamenti]
MHDETPAPPTPNDRIDEPNANCGPAPSRRGRGFDRDGSDRDGSDRADDRPRDGVDPPGETGGDRSERDRSETDEDCDSAPVEYRLERLRLLRTVVTLAVVIARLIRSV